MAFTGINTAQAILKAYFQAIPLTLTSAVYVEMWTSQGTNTSPGTPLSYSGSGRQLLQAGTGFWTVANPINQVTNAVAITYQNAVPGTVTQPLPAILQVGLWDAASAGNVLWALDIAVQYQKQFGSGDQPIIPIGGAILILN